MGKQHRKVTSEEKIKPPRDPDRKALRFSRRVNDRDWAIAEVRGHYPAHQSDKQLLEYLIMEKHRIGQHLHDHLCQQLTGIAFMLQMLEQDLQGRAAREAQDAAKILEIVGLAVTQTRGLAGVLGSGAPRGWNLIVALQEMASGFERLFHISCQFSTDRDLRLQRDENAWPLYYLAQEAIHFAVRYHDAKTVALNLAQTHDAIILDIVCESCGKPRGPERHQEISKKMIKYFAALMHATVKARLCQDRYTLRCTYWDQ
jgi:signal transduction histidine kinase